MSRWIDCTNLKGERIFVNLDSAVLLSRNAQGTETRITFAGSDEIVVNETPEQLLERNRSA